MTKPRSIMVAAVLVISTPARADFIDTAKDIITQVIEDDLATQAIPNAAKKIPVACEFFPSTIFALKNKRYSGLTSILRKEASDAAGFVVLTKVAPHIVGPAPAPGSTAAVKPWFQTRATAASSTSDAAGTDEIDATAVTMLHQSARQTKTSTRVDVAQTSTCDFNETRVSKATRALERCVTTKENPERELGCAAGLMTRDAAMNAAQQLPADARRLAVAIIVASLAPLPTDGGTAKITTASIVRATAVLAAGLADGTPDEKLATSFCSTLLVAPTDADMKTCTSISDKSIVLIRSARFDVATLEQTLAVADEIAQLCTASTNPSAKSACGVFHDLAHGSEGLVRDIESGDYGGAAGAVFDVTQQITCKDRPGACSDVDDKVFAFLRAFAVYSVDTVSSGSPPASDDADFKQAAVDLIEAAAGPGINRSRWSLLYVPSFTLRDSWLPGHIGNTSTLMARYPSLEFFRTHFSWQPKSTYIGLTGSAFDVIGPAVELGTKNPALSTSATVFALGFVVPRAEIEFGVPSITKNLVIGVGGALRFYRAEIVDPNAMRFTYCVMGDNSCRSDATSYLELSAFIRYVP